MPDKPIIPDAGNETGCRASGAHARKPYLLRPTVTPVSSIPSDGHGARLGKRTCQDDPFVRPAHEDDDGYDPYSDRREEPPLFENNPWD